MKMSSKINKVKKNNWLNIAFDVGKDDLHMYMETGTKTIRCYYDRFANKTEMIVHKLKELKRLARSHGYKRIHIICEPTGGYENKLMQLSFKQGCASSYVSGEAMHKFKVVEGNNTDKSDRRDPRVILKLACYGKLLKHRVLDSGYEKLRQLNLMHEQDHEMKVLVRNYLGHELSVLFNEQAWKEAFWFSKSGRAVLNLYGGNPYRIVRSGKSIFSKRMKRVVKGIRKTTLDRIFSNARISVTHQMDPSLAEIHEQRITDLWRRFIDHERTLKGIKEQMVGIYNHLLEKGEELPPAIDGFVSISNLARIAGETGPFSDFRSARQIKGYAGLNLLSRESGYYKGRARISRKGRVRLRKILSQSIFHLVKKDRILGSYYHGLKERGMSGTKAMSVVSRKLVDILFAISKPGVSFDQQRMFKAEQSLTKAA